MKIGAELRQGAVTANGEGEAVAGIVLMLKGASGRDVVNAVKEKLPAIQKALPKGVELVPFYDRTDLVKKAIHTVTKALAEGAVFVLIILIVLLADVRSAIIVTLVLPLAALFAFIMMKWYGLSANLMSLGGLAIGIGMMVDGAVVMVENIHRHLTEKPSDPARHHARRQNRNRALRREGSRPADRLRHLHHHHRLSAALHAGGFRGKNVQPARVHDFFRAARLAHPFAHARADALHLFPEAGAARARSVSHPLAEAYLSRHCLKPCVRHPWLVVLAALLALGGAFALVPRIGTEFLPALDEGSIAVQTFRIPSISLPQSLALQGKAEKLLKQFPEVIDVVSKTGRADIASDPMGVELSDVIVTLKPHEEWTTTKSKDELVEKMREALGELPGVASSFSQPIALRVDELVSGVKSAIGIKIFGDDLDVLKQKARRRRARARQGPRRGRRQRREGQRPRLSPNRNRSRQDRALRHQRRRHPGRDRDRHRRARKRARSMKA